MSRCHAIRSSLAIAKQGLPALLLFALLSAPLAARAVPRSGVYGYAGVTSYSTVVIEKGDADYGSLEGGAGIVGAEWPAWEDVNWYAEGNVSDRYRSLSLGIHLVDEDSVILPGELIAWQRGINRLGPFLILDLSVGLFADAGDYQDALGPPRDERIWTFGVEAGLHLFEIRGERLFATLLSLGYRVGLAAEGSVGVASLGLKAGYRF